MFKQAKPFFLIVETPLHAGSGTDLGIVDLPIQREKHTDYPKVEASGLKGAIREVFRTQPNLTQLTEWGITSIEDSKYTKAIDLAFGPDTSNESDLHAGALGFTDARILLFPVKSVSGVFGWITCPAVLERFKHDLSICQPDDIQFVDNIPGINTITTNSDLTIENGSELTLEDDINDQKQIVLEEYTFPVTPVEECDLVAKWIATHILPSDPSYGYWQDKMKKDIIILSNDDFRDFVTLSTEVIARIKMDPKTGTVDKNIGGLWYEEYLPTDSILYSLALASPIFKEREVDKGIFAVVPDEDETLDESKLAVDSDEKGGLGESEPETVVNSDEEGASSESGDESEPVVDSDRKGILGESEPEKVMNFFEVGLPRIIQLGGNAAIGKGIVRTRVYEG